EFSQERYSTYHHKVAQLGASLFPGYRTIEVTHMKGGSFNRVIGLTLTPPGPRKYTWDWFCREWKSLFGRSGSETLEEYILRIPRMSWLSNLDADIATLQFVGPHLDLPIPRSVHYDLSEDNVIGAQYMLQQRLRGQTLSPIFDRLNLAQKVSIARQVTQLVHQLASVTSDAGGRPARMSASGFSHQLEQLEIPSRTISWDLNPAEPVPSTPQSPVDFLIGLCKRWNAWDDEEHGGEIVYEEIWHGLAGVARGLEELGFLDADNIFYLCHGDLQPYNLLVEVRDEEHVEITGILDWDSAIFAPSFMAYKPPYWLWYPAEAATREFDREESANIEPASEHGRVMKQIFLKNASPEFLKYAFAPEAIIARKVLTHLRHGFKHKAHAEMAMATIEEWQQLHPDPEDD
ncbi:hypothetical protein K491DRAFT_570426, partial [Lophiostoma macrostomum CBS 122681]